MRFVAAGKEGVSGFIVPSLLLLVVAYIAYQYLAAIGPYWNISPDSATYVEAARSLAGGSAHGIAASRPHPPVTSVLFAPLLAVWPDGYRALNGLNTALLLAALFLAYRLLVRKAGPRHAALTILLTLGSIRFFHESAQLLSEPAYMFLSLLVLFLIDRQSGQ